MTDSAKRAQTLAIAIVNTALRAQKDKGEALASIAMALGIATLTSSVPREVAHTLLDHAIDAVKPGLAASGILPS